MRLSTVVLPVQRWAEAGGRARRQRAEELTGFNPERPPDSVDAFVDRAGVAYAGQGIDEIVPHRPVPDTVFAGDERTFEKTATDGLAQLPGLPQPTRGA